MDILDKLKTTQNHILDPINNLLFQLEKSKISESSTETLETIELVPKF